MGEKRGGGIVGESERGYIVGERREGRYNRWERRGGDMGGHI